MMKHRDTQRPRGWLATVAKWRSVVFALVGLAGIVGIWGNLPPIARSAAQDEKLADAPTDSGGAKAGKASEGMPEPTLLDMFWASGLIGMIITLLSLVAVGFIVEHAITIRKTKLLPEGVLKDLGDMIAQGQIDPAIEYCLQPDNESLVADVVLAGLERYKASEFGFAEYKTAMEEAGEDATSRLYRKTDALSVIGAIAPMLGLLGTVQGMILAFNTIASKGGMARPDELAGSISLALVTTFEGLVVAIPAMVAFSYFRNKIDSLVAEAGSRVEHVMMPLARRRWQS